MLELSPVSLERNLFQVLSVFRHHTQVQEKAALTGMAPNFRKYNHIVGKSLP